MSDALPRVLSMQLKRFQQARVTTQVLEPLNRSEFGPSETTIFRFPLTNIDLQSVALRCKVKHTGTLAAATRYFYLGELIKSVRLFIDDVQIGYASCSDYAKAYLLRRRWAESPSLDSTSNHGFEFLRFPIVAANGTATIDFVMGDILDFLGSRNVRILPCALLKSVRLEIEWARPSTRVDTLTDTVVFTPQLVFQQLAYAGNILESAFAARLAQGPIEIAFNNISMYEGNTITVNGEYQFSLSCQSLDHLVLTGTEPAATAATYYNTTAGDSGATFQVQMNGQPVFSKPIDCTQCYIESMFATDGFNNQLVNPKGNGAENGTFTSTVWATERFAIIKRLTHPMQGSDESRNLISGVSTQMQNMPFVFQAYNIGATGFKPLVIAYHTSTLVLQPGGSVGVAN